MAKPFANSGDPDQTPHSAASDLGLHCFPITLLRVSRQQWVNLYFDSLSRLSPLRTIYMKCKPLLTSVCRQGMLNVSMLSVKIQTCTQASAGTISKNILRKACHDVTCNAGTCISTD